MPVIDFSNVKALEAIPEDTYRCTIGDVERKKPTDPKKFEYYAVKFVVADEDSEYNGRSVFRNYSTSPNSLWALKQFMLVAGTDPELFEGEIDVDEEMINLKGAEVDVQVAFRTYVQDGEEKIGNEVRKVTSPGL